MCVFRGALCLDMVSIEDFEEEGICFKHLNPGFGMKTYDNFSLVDCWNVSIPCIPFVCMF